MILQSNTDEEIAVRFWNAIPHPHPLSPIGSNFLSDFPTVKLRVESETETLVASEREGLCNDENAQSLRGMCERVCVRAVYWKSHLSLYWRFPP